MIFCTRFGRYLYSTKCSWIIIIIIIIDQGDCFAWLSCWKAAPTHVVVGTQELYQQLLPTKVFYHRKVGTSVNGEERCRMCGKATESVPHILAGCGALAQTLYLARHNNALKILFFFK